VRDLCVRRVVDSISRQEIQTLRTILNLKFKDPQNISQASTYKTIEKEEAIRPHLSASKSSKAQAHISRTDLGFTRSFRQQPLVGDGSVTCQHDDVTINQSSDSLVTENPSRMRGDIPEIVTEEVAQEGVQGQSSATAAPCHPSVASQRSIS